MNYPGIRIEGGILSPDILSKVEDLPNQSPTDFGLDSNAKVKDEIARAWADAQDYWRMFQRKLESVKPDNNATTETRNLWMVPLLGLLGYDMELQKSGIKLNGNTYAISHFAANRANAAIQIIGYQDPAGLDKKPENATRRMSAHALVQEFLNLDEQLYGIVTNGKVLRLLRDSSRLVRLSYLEFDLDRIFTDGLYADFAVLYRLLHFTRLPKSHDAAADSLIEKYHQDSLESGARIREGLSKAVEQAIRDFANGFLQHESNSKLREVVANEALSPANYYQQLLRLIYRLLFLMVIEERDLVFPPATPKKYRDIYRDYYSLARLRRLSEKRYLADPRRHDLWLALRVTFKLFEADGPGKELGIGPLAGDLFSPEAIKSLATCTLSNDILLKCLRSLGLYQHPETKQMIRVNYAALNVEEFGSVYEGLLEYDPIFTNEGREIGFDFTKGKDRAASGSHYTPEDFVQPLIKHSLDHLIDECKKIGGTESALLNLRVADIACGSGHILLAAARRIATELATVRTKEEQPSPDAYREALRDTIGSCIYGVDLNPLAVELCKVALWLEAHIPGEPLNFLDHHIKCGNAIVGFARHEELARGVPNEAFKKLPGDDAETAKNYRKRNKQELEHQKQTSLDFTPQMQGHFDEILKDWRTFASRIESTPEEVEAKKADFANLDQDEHMAILRDLADIPIAQFYIPKTHANEQKIITDAEFRSYWLGEKSPQGLGVQEVRTVSENKQFFHWFLEFPEVMERGGFDCILGNPPYLGRKNISRNLGDSFCQYIRWIFKPIGLSDLVVFFLRRIHGLLRDNSFTAIITTNSIIDGDVRKDGLEQILSANSSINMAVRHMNWPGAANLVVSLLSIYKGQWDGLKMLDNHSVEHINSFFEESEKIDQPFNLQENQNRIFQGSIFLGDGFLLTHEEANAMRNLDFRNDEVIDLTINGKELNGDPKQNPGRSIINFHNWALEKAQLYPDPYQRVLELVKPVRDENRMKNYRENWWLFGFSAAQLYDNIHTLPRCFAACMTTKYLSFSSMPTNIVFTNAVYVFTTDRWDLFTIVQSTIHEVWARKYSGSLETRLRYSPSDCFDTFPFPDNLWQTPNPELAEIGERYHEHRKALMLSLWLGLTKIYNLFHDPELTPEVVAKVSKKDLNIATAGYESLLKLRDLHIQMDTAVRDAYGWQDLDLEHGFHEVETLPENDRTRHTISPKARRETLKRLLEENHRRAAEQPTTPKPNRPKPKSGDSASESLIPAEE